MTWTQLPLASYLTRITYGFTNPMPTTEEGPWMVTAKDIRGGRIDYSSARRTSIEAYTTLLTDKSRPRVGDLLLTKDGSIGRVAICDRADVCINQSVALLQLKDGIDARFLAYLLQAPMYQDRMGADADGSTIQHIYITRVDKMPILVPDLATQRAIAEVLGALDDKIAANATTCDVAERLAGSIYYRATEAVKRVPASALLTPVLGGTPDRADASCWSGDNPWVSAKDIAAAPAGVILDTSEHISARGVATSRAKLVPAGSVILTARGTVGAVARLGMPAAFNQSCYAFVPSDAIPASYLYMLVKDAAREALSVAHGSVFSTITMRSFDALTVPAAEGAMVCELDVELSALLRAVSAHAFESRQLANLRDMLLPHLMSGRITVREAEKTVEEVL